MQLQHCQFMIISSGHISCACFLPGMALLDLGCSCQLYDWTGLLAAQALFTTHTLCKLSQPMCQ